MLQFRVFERWLLHWTSGLKYRESVTASLVNVMTEFVRNNFKHMVPDGYTVDAVTPYLLG